SRRFVSCRDSAPPGLYTLSLHDALPISHDATGGDLPQLRRPGRVPLVERCTDRVPVLSLDPGAPGRRPQEGRHGCGSAAVELARSEEHTSELQSLAYLVCRLLLEKKKDN